MQQFIFYLFLVLVACAACQPQAEGDDRPPPIPIPSPDPPSEDELLLRLAGMMNDDSSRQAQDRNAIVGYALEHLLDVQALPSGLVYEVLEPGSADKLAWGDYVRVNYRGYFLDGTVFADTWQRGEPFEFYVGNMIPAWNEGLTLVGPGGYLRLLVPSDLGYGADGLEAGSRTLVPPHQILAFEIEVLEKLPKPE
ncbi:MAG: hypothetical protein D6772_05420 [Bacteroidetes bacterium]|nr:MAG: hypothetical protein D6772_05420 [Bacteroidota bacterium]